MSDKVIRFAKLTADRSWKRWSDRRLRQERAARQRLESAGIYLDYDADTEQHRIQLHSGRVLAGESITNAGLATGDPVVVQGRKFKSMPR